MIRRPGVILFLLTGLNLLNYLDRQILAAILPRIKSGLSLSYTVAGALASIFIIGYSATSPVFGALGDRMKRKGLITAGVLVWSIATVASGLAQDGTQLLVARAFVGIGEASYATLAPTIIDDVTPADRKGRALAIFFAATPIGSALGYLVGGFVSKHWDWRTAFFVAGGPGVVLALSVLLIAEPERKPRAKAHVLRDLGALFTTKLYRKAVLGYCAFTAAIGAFGHWSPTFLVETYKLDEAVANFRFGIVLVVAGAIGTFAGGRWGDRLAAKAKDEEGAINAFLRVCALGSVAGAPFAVAAYASPSATLFFVFAFFAILALFVSTSPINAAILRSVPSELRASAMALSILSIHALGDGWSPSLVGQAADRLPMRIAMMILPLSIAVSAVLWWPRRRPA